jgi:excisionase family DNA binding protein
MPIDKPRNIWYIVFSYMTNVLLTAKEVANYLKLNILTIYQYVRGGKLKAVKFGRNYRIEKKELDKFIESSRTHFTLK